MAAARFSTGDRVAFSEESIRSGRKGKVIYVKPKQAWFMNDVPCYMVQIDGNGWISASEKELIEFRNSAR